MVNVEFAAVEYAVVAGSTLVAGRFQELYVVHAVATPELKVVPVAGVDDVRAAAGRVPGYRRLGQAGQLAVAVAVAVAGLVAGVAGGGGPRIQGGGQHVVARVGGRGRGGVVGVIRVVRGGAGTGRLVLT